MVGKPLSSRAALANRILAAVACLLALTACDPTLGIGLPGERALEDGAVATLGKATSFEIVGSYGDDGGRWIIDLQVVRPNTEHIVLTGPDQKIEAIVLGGRGYFRGQQFLAQHLGNDPLSLDLLRAEGNSWWNGPVAYFPRLPDLTDGATFRSTFLGSASSTRTDHHSVDAVDAVELSGARADVFIASSPPFSLLRVHMKKGVVIDGLGEADLTYGAYNRDFAIKAPTDVIDFSNLSALPPLYTVVSVDTLECLSPSPSPSVSPSPLPSPSVSPPPSVFPSPSAAPSTLATSTCVVSALLKNLGGPTGAQAPSTVTFTMTDPVSRMSLGSCQVQVQPDVGYNATTTVSCTLPIAQPQNAALVTATANNPGPG